MKTAQEYAIEFIERKGIYLEDIIEQAQKEAYNQALEDAVKNAEAKIDVWYDYDDKAYKRGEAIVDKKSILKLKK